ncbi:spore germination protein, partial [Carboxydocella sp. JDF658]|uniref:spore germination protein n=1 Tax=Carboxydocella sp. JDF658 TaxID=1926600 RepID=UPI0009D2763D
EAGARLPRAIGQTISIVGGLVIGNAAVQAGIASQIMIIIVAITAIASFAIPHYNVAAGLRLMRFPLM